METIFSPHSLSPRFNIKASSTQTLLSPSVQPKSNSHFCNIPVTSSLRKHQSLPLKSSLPTGTSWLTHAQQGLAALAISLALNFSPLLPSGNALASEFDVLNEGPPKETYVVDDAGVLSRVTRSDLKQLLSDLESRKKFHINFVTIRKLTSKADAFEYADQVLERWYPSVYEGNNKGIVVLVTSQKEGAITGGPFLMPPYQRTCQYWQRMRSTMKLFLALPNGWSLPLMGFQILVDPNSKTTNVSLTSNPGKRLKRNVDNSLL